MPFTLLYHLFPRLFSLNILARFEGVLMTRDPRALLALAKTIYKWTDLRTCLKSVMVAFSDNVAWYGWDRILWPRHGQDTFLQGFEKFDELVKVRFKAAAPALKWKHADCATCSWLDDRLFWNSSGRFVTRCQGFHLFRYSRARSATFRHS